MSVDADAIVVGAGLAGLVATAELAAAGRRVIVVEQEPEVSLGGQAFWSFGGLFLVNSPEQRRMGIRDSHDLALQDWLGSAGLRPAGRRVAPPVGGGLRRVRRRREAGLAARQGRAVLPGRRLGRARRLRGRRARQLGPAVPHHLGNRARCARAVRARGARGGRVRPGAPAVPAPGRRAHRSPAAPSTACAAASSRQPASSGASRARAR